MSLLDRHLKIPKYLQLAETIRQQIAAGVLQSGDQLPSFTQLRKEFGATQNTVEKVFGLLEQDGLIVREPSRGTFVAQPQRRASTGVIGFMGNAFTARQKFSYFAHIADGVQSEAERHGKRVLLLGNSVSWNEDDISKVDGVLLCDAENSEHVLQRLPRELPCVAMMVAAPEVPSVVADDYGGARSAVHHLVELGHRQIGCLISSGLWLPQLRFQGYRDALRECGVAPPKKWCRRPRLQGPPRTDYVTWGRQQMQAWLSAGFRENGCTALLAQNDLAAIGAIQALQDAGIRVPEDVSVVGFDGTELCEYFAPRLSSVEVPLHEIGARAVGVLCARIEQVEQGRTAGEIESIVLPTRFQARESSAAPKVLAKAKVLRG
jgi:DNA-binding LacI/PurR family transcriptional regulator